MKTRNQTAGADVRPSTPIGGVLKAPRRLIDLDEEELAERVQDAVAPLLADLLADLLRNREPELLGGAQMAAKLSISRSKLHVLRTEGCPSVKVGDVFKYEPAAVMAWLKARGAK